MATANPFNASPLRTIAYSPNHHDNSKAHLSLSLSLALSALQFSANHHSSLLNYSFTVLKL